MKIRVTGGSRTDKINVRRRTGTMPERLGYITAAEAIKMRDELSK